MEKDGEALAGGRPLKTPFGTFYTPNITPDKEHGIGAWSAAEFHRAMRSGIGRHGEYLYPVFPYTSFTGMTDRDIADLYAYLMAQPASPRANTPNEIGFPFNIRLSLFGWRLLFFKEGPLEPLPEQSAEINRGRYLAEALGHCQECHTPRNFLGAMRRGKAMSGNLDGPDGQEAPNITPHDSGIGKWSVAEIEDLLDSGVTPTGDYVGSGMADVVKGTGKLSPEDRHAIAVYLKSLPPLPSTPRKTASQPSRQ